MKKLNVQILLTFSLCVLLSLGCVSCNAKEKSPKRQLFSQIDSLMKVSIGDSISTIIYQAKQVTAERINIKNDTLSVIKKRKLDAEELSILRFLMASSEKYVGNAVVFGNFSPNVRFSFETKKAKCVVLMDFGLKQAIIKDETDREVAKFGLTDDGFLKFVNVLYPNDKFLNFLLKQQYQ